MSLKETVAEDGPDGPGAASKFSEGLFCYELRIPLVEIGGKFSKKTPSEKRKIALGIQIGGLTEAEKEMRNEHSAMGRPGGDGGSRGGGSGAMGGGGGGRGGGMGGPRGGGPTGGRGDGARRDPDPKVQWLSLTLPAST